MLQTILKVVVFLCRTQLCPAHPTVKHPWVGRPHGKGLTLEIVFKFIRQGGTTSSILVPGGRLRLKGFSDLAWADDENLTNKEVSIVGLQPIQALLITIFDNTL